MQPSAMQQQCRLGFVDSCTCANTNIEPFSNTLEKNCTLHLYVRKQRFAPLAALINGIGIVYIIHITITTMIQIQDSDEHMNT